MQTKTNRRGLAIGAAVALVGSLFGAAPASYAVTDGQYIDIRPLSNAGTTVFGGLITEDFPIYAQLKPGSSNANSNFSDSNLLWEVTYVSGLANMVAVATTTSATVGAPEGGIADGTTITSTSAQIATGSFLVTGATVSNRAFAHHTTSVGVTTVTLSAKVNSAGVAPLFLRALSTSAFTTTSANAVYDIRVFIDELGGANGKFDSGEWFTTQRVTLYATGNLAPSLSVGSPARADTVVTASATLASVNWSNLNGRAFLQVSSSDTAAVFTGNNNSSASPTISGLVATTRGGVFSHSFAVTSLTESTTITGQLRYAADGTVTASSGVAVGSSLSAVVSAPGVTNLSVTASAGVNIKEGTGAQLLIRPNQTYTIQVLASTGSGNASVSTDVTVSLSGTALTLGSRTIAVNGGAATATYPSFTVTTGTDGVGTFTLTTVGFVAAEAITVSAKVGNVTATAVQLLVQDATYTVAADSTHYATAPGTAVTLGFNVKDQWGVMSSRTDHFLKVTRSGSGFNWSTTISHEAVTAGRASFAVTPSPATATGSMTVTVQSTRLLTGAYVDLGGNTSVTITVTASAMAFGSGLAASQAATVSYYPSTVSWVTVTGNASAAGAGITASGTDLVFRLNADVPATSSATFALNAGAAGAYSFQVAALKPGNKTVTLKTGTATTTSLLVVGQGGSDQGRTITWDTTTIESGKTRVVTGTLLDLNGNGIDTTAVGRTAGDSGTASIVVTYTGTAGIVVGTMPTETDADGKFRVSVLTSAADSGTITITAVYMPQGASTVAAQKVTSVQALTVAPAAAAEVNAVIGSFNGRWAVRVENAKGSVVSVKAGNRWVKFTALNNNYLFSRKSVVGRTIAVSVWVDGELQNSQTITIK